MKRILFILLFLTTATHLSAGESERRERWLIATTSPAELILRARAEVPELGPNRGELRARTISTFRHVRGFAAELTATEARALESLPFVRWVEPDRTRHLLSDGQPVLVPNESGQRIPFGISMIRATEVWNVSRAASVRVGIADTGVDLMHPDLAARYAGGYDFVNRDDDPQDDNGHGTHVAGTIAAVDNDFGVVGVAPEAKIYALKVLDSSGTGSTSALIEAVEWAIDHDLDVLNMSLGSEESSRLEREAFNLAEEAGLIAVAASGNSYAGFNRIDYPANYPSVIAVGAIDAAEAIAAFSQRGANLEFVAPGVGVESTIFSTFYGITDSDGDVLQGQRMEFSPGGTVSGELVDCDLGMPGQCPSSVDGEIALIRRGELTFAAKSETAKLAGAKAVVIYNHNADDAPEGGVILGTLGSEGDWILTVGTSRSSGEHLLSLTDHTITLAEMTGSGYAKLNGTSMATPHVAGAIAILRELAPFASKFQIVEALRSTAKDLGDPGRDDTFGYGRIDVEQAARTIAPGAFGSAESRRRSIRRPVPGN